MKKIYVIGAVIFLLLFVLLFAGQKLHPSSNFEQLMSLQYMTWSSIADKDLNKSGVIYFDGNKANFGINVFCYDVVNVTSAIFMTMNGNIIHNITADSAAVPVYGDSAYCKLLERHGDDFLMLIKDRDIVLLDWDSNVKSVLRGSFHHDLDVDSEGNIYALNKVFSPSKGLYDEILAVISDGEIVKNVSFLKMISKNKELLDFYEAQKAKTLLYGSDSFDALHANTVELIKKDIFSGSQKIFKKGDILFALRNMDLIGIVDIDREEIVWYWGPGILDAPHNPAFMDNGNILIFDNGMHRNYSRVVELNPSNISIEWEYVAEPAESFFSATRGSAQRLPNGNTLIVESDKGHVFEVTRGKELVWDFWSPDTKDGQRRTLYRFTRFPIEDFAKLKDKIR